MRPGEGPRRSQHAAFMEDVCQMRQPQTISQLAYALGVLGEWPRKNSGTIVLKTTTGRTMLLKDDPVSSGTHLVECAMVRVLKMTGMYPNIVSTLCMPVREREIEENAPYLEDKEYRTYLRRCGSRRGAWNQVSVEKLLSGPNYLGESIQVQNPSEEQIREVIDKAKGEGFSVMFVFDRKENESSAYSRYTELYKSTPGRLVFHMPRTDLAPLASGPEDVAELDRTVMRLVQWIETGDIPIGRLTYLLDKQIARVDLESTPCPKMTGQSLRDFKKIMQSDDPPRAAADLGYDMGDIVNFQDFPKTMVNLAEGLRWYRAEMGDAALFAKFSHVLADITTPGARDWPNNATRAAIYHMAENAEDLCLGKYRNQTGSSGSEVMATITRAQNEFWGRDHIYLAPCDRSLWDFPGSMKVAQAVQRSNVMASNVADITERSISLRDRISEAAARGDTQGHHGADESDLCADTTCEC